MGPRHPLEPPVADHIVEVGKGLGEWARVRVEVHEHEAAPFLDGVGGETHGGGIEPSAGGHVGSGGQAAVEAIRPQVVGALDRSHAAVPVEDRCVAVLAHVRHRPERTVRAANHCDRFVGDRGGDKVARFGKVGHMSDRQPGAFEDHR